MGCILLKMAAVSLLTGGVYNCCRAFMPMLVGSEHGAVVNTASINGFFASERSSSVSLRFYRASPALLTPALLLPWRLLS